MPATRLSVFAILNLYSCNNSTIQEIDAQRERENLPKITHFPQWQNQALSSDFGA